MGAYFRFCLCARHGHIVLADGSITPEACSKQGAREILKLAYNGGDVTLVEKALAETQIRQSRLEELEKEVHILLSVKVQIINERNFSPNERIDVFRSLSRGHMYVEPTQK
ncbi:MAG: hypothetical protein KW806_02875 [Candidatus Yanofskybacteria bacterium]|nr:hypothetical protein [Candidatus Yanofskybacteria bacterium]